MIRPFFEAFFAIVFLVWGRWYADTNLQSELYGMTIGLCAALIIEFATWLYHERNFLKLYWRCYIYYHKPELRLSIAYIYSIEVQGKYLLVKSNRISNTYQPVGGVYKYFHPEASLELKNMNAIPDNAITNDDVSENDLRLKLRNRKNIRKFLKWFFSESCREWDAWREFYEELVDTGILPEQEFKYIHYELVGQHFEPIHYDEHFKIDTFKYTDVLTPKFINERQKNELRMLLNQNNSEFIWVTEEEIMRKVSDDGKRIADHSYKIFHNKKLK